MGQARLKKMALGDAYGSSPEIAWHYTLGRKVPLILRDGFLRDTWTDANRKEYPGAFYSIWFTLSDKVDPTSTASLSQRRSYPSEPRAFKEATGGHWRLGLHTSDKRLVSYSQVLDMYPPSSRAGRFLRGLPRHGENRNMWLVSTENISSSDLIYQELDAKSWITHPFHSLSHFQEAPGYGLPGVSAAELGRFFSNGVMFNGA